MKPRNALLLAWALFAAGVVMIVLAMAAVAQQDERRVPVAGFACQNGVCVTTEAQLDRLGEVWRLMEQRIRECRGRREI